MIKKSIRNTLLALAVIAIPATALGAGGPIKKPKEIDWSFAGPFGKYDPGQLQRGFKVYREVCAACHSLEYVAFRNLIGNEGIWFTEDEAKAVAAEYEVEAEPDDEGEVEMRTAILSDHFPPVFENNNAAAAANNGAAPPDFSLLAKARAVERGFPTFVFDIFTMYRESGPDYIHSLLTGYEDAPEGTEIGEGTYYNPYYIGGNALSMAPPLSDELVDYTDGAPMTVDQYSKDVTAFMMWAAEPKMTIRKALGFKVILFLIIFAGLMYWSKRLVWANIKH